jgi:branched-chain amino acid transport system substrate-binding protein
MRTSLLHRFATTAKFVGMAAIALTATSAAINPASAQKKYDPGATDTEIKIGQTVPFSGPASAYSSIAKTQLAYFKMVNDQGGVNGRKINLIQYDDAYSPPKAVEQVRKLVESDEVLLTFQIIGTPSNAGVQKYLNQKQVPQLFAATGATRFTDPKNFPWTMGYNPNYQTEGRIYAKYILKNHPTAKIAILWQNDDLGRDYLTGMKAGLGDKAASMIVSEASYELADPTIDSQIVKLKSSGADLLVQRLDAEIRRAGDQEGGRSRLEAGPHRRHQCDLGRRGAGACGARQFQGPHLDQLRQGPAGPAVEGR